MLLFCLFLRKCINDNKNVFISNDFFLDACDFVYDENFDTSKLFDGCKIFLENSYIDDFSKIVKDIKHSFKLISRNNKDFMIDFTEGVSNILINNKLIKWGAINVAVIHPKLIVLPLGNKWQYHSTEFHGEDKTPILKSLLVNNANNPKENFLKHKFQLLYCNLSVNSTSDPIYTAHKGIRKLALNSVKNNNVCETSPVKPFESYLSDLQKYKFTLSPPGRGIDTHRCWEALLMGSIPIIYHDPVAMLPLYEDLPVLVIKDWNILTKDYLNNQYENMISKKYNWEKLFMNYWINIIEK